MYHKNGTFIHKIVFSHRRNHRPVPYRCERGRRGVYSAGGRLWWWCRVLLPTWHDGRLGCKFRRNSGRNSGSGGSYGHFHRILDPGLFTFRSLLHWRTTGMWRHDVTKNPEVVGVRPEATRITSFQYTVTAISQSEITTWMPMGRCVFLCVFKRLAFICRLAFTIINKKKRRKPSIHQHHQHQHVSLSPSPGLLLYFLLVLNLPLYRLPLRWF